MNATIAVSKPVVKNVNLSEGEQYKLKVWDCGGQERFANISKAFLKDAVGCIIIFSIDAPKSIDIAKSWIQQVAYMRDQEHKQIQVVLVANKCDLPDNKVEFKEWNEEGKKLASQSSTPGNEVSFFGTSAKTGKNIEEVFLKMATLVKSANDKKASASNEGVVPATDKEGGGCCIVS